MKPIIIFCLCFAFSMLDAQQYKDVAPVFYKRCTGCHHEGAHDSPFMNYAQTKAKAPEIYSALITGRMPPWKADTSYTRFMHERLITAPEKQSILDWISAGTPKGDTTQAPAAPVYPSQFQLAGQADLTLGIGHFTSTSVSTDKYYCFSIPAGLTEDRIIRAFEVVPGNKAMVHHAVITADTTGSFTSDLSGYCYNIAGNVIIGSYAPGTRATVFPSSPPLQAGIYLKAGSSIIIQLHYPAGSAGLVDSTKIRLYFYPSNTSGVRRIYSMIPLQNWSMSIPANSVVTHTAYFPSAGSGIPVDVSVFGVMPHSHLLCKSVLNYALLPGVDTIPLVRINHWDFEWQDYYNFKRLVKIPAGYRLYGEHVFDNTGANPHNPHNPPVNVFAGTGTYDEMLFDGMLFLLYQAGDELIDMESIIANDPLLGIRAGGQPSGEFSCRAVPNPFSGRVAFHFEIRRPADAFLGIYDALGKQVFAGQRRALPPGAHEWEWGGAATAAAGIYYYVVSTGEGYAGGKLIRR